MEPTAASTAPAHDHAADHPSGRPLVLTLAALLVLTAISWVMSHVPLGGASTPIALLIAGIKASIVAVWFMELPRASGPAKITAAVTLSFIVLLCGGIVADVALR